MTKREVKKLLKQKGRTWREFESWMSGQTVGLNKDGTVNYYEEDVERFIERLLVVD